MLHRKEVLIYFSVIMFLWACDSKPKVIVADENITSGSLTEGMSSAMNSETPSNTGFIDVHQVVANEILQSERYTYLRVTEAGKNFWIATSKTDALKGQTYLYRGGLMKTNFESVEFKRTFDTIYLVSNIINASEHPGSQPAISRPLINDATNETAGTLPVVKDAIKLSELMTNKVKYDGKIITISGECVKVNNGIMGRNWVHIQDGSKEKGKPLDLTVTTNLNIVVGSKIALKGKISLNKDFGAGYRYDVIMEDAAGI